MDWFRKKTWTEKDEEEFFAKLKRARKDGRPQYLKIQGIELVETKDEKLLEVAEVLLNKVLTEFHDDNFNKSSTLHTLGDIYKIRNDFDKALFYYKQSLDFEKNYPNVITQSYIDFSELVVRTKKEEYFDYVENVLEKKLPSESFPISKYKIALILSYLNHVKNNNEKSKFYSNLAEENATAETSGFRYHKHLGLVKERNIWLEKLL
jgi:tetratricopeptide (TPR) repeat protein